MTILMVIDFLALLSFSISGALAAYSKKLDAFGITIIAFVTAAGGGTLRDILIGVRPVSWMQNMNLVYTILFGVIITLLFRKYLHKLRKTFFLFDTIGLGLYTVSGVQIGLRSGFHPLICIVLGCISACFGGMLRDILVNEIPVIFRKNIYATACIFGGVVYMIMLRLNFPQYAISTITAGSVITLRTLAVRYKWQLPSPHTNDKVWRKKFKK